MQAIIKNGKVLATHHDGQDLSGKYPGAVIRSTSERVVPDDVWVDDLSVAKTSTLVQLQREYQSLLTTKHDGTDRYPSTWMAGARELMSAYRDVAADADDRATVAAALDMTEAGLVAEMKAKKQIAKQVLNWQFNKLAPYFYSVRQQIAAAQTSEDVNAIAWDFTPYLTEAEGGTPATADPDVGLDDLQVVADVGGSAVTFMSVYAGL